MRKGMCPLKKRFHRLGDRLIRLKEPLFVDIQLMLGGTSPSGDREKDWSEPIKALSCSSNTQSYGPSCDGRTRCA